MPLPTDDRRRLAIIKFVARYLPLVDAHEYADDLRLPEPKLPGWYGWAVGVVLLIYGCVVATVCVWLLNINVLASLNPMAVKVFAMMIQPAWIMAAIFTQMPQHKRAKIYFWLMPIVLAEASGFAAFATVILLQAWL
jgi:hypothetical protein